LLKGIDEIALIKEMSSFPEIIQQAADEYEPSVISNYLLSLASLFNRYYRYHRVIDTSNRALSQLRFALVQCLKYILHTGLTLLGITVLEEM
ncbi:DALR anticodon-binding domain-containing protein, partial [Planctomycetota bacterium]